MKQRIINAILIVLSLSCVAALGYGYNQLQLYVRDHATIGHHKRLGKLGIKASKVGEATVYIRTKASQTSPALDIENSAESDIFTVSEAGNVVVAGTLSTTGATTQEGGLTINGPLYVDGDGVSDVQGRFDGTSGQAVDIFQVRTYDGTEKIDVSSAGVIGLKSAVACGATLGVTGATTLTGAATFSASMVPSTQGSDPCGTLAVGSIYWTGAIMCYCNQNGVDLKIDGTSAGCSY